MFVDASAIIAIIIGEPERLAFEARLEQADRIYTSPLAIYEAVMGVARIRRLSIGDAQSVVLFDGTFMLAATFPPNWFQSHPRSGGPL